MKMLIVVLIALLPMLASAETPNSSAPAAVTPATPTPAADNAYLDGLKTKYKLTDAQVLSLKNSGLPDPQLAKVAQLSKSSGKTIDEVLAMRTTQHMGWGEIAKKLGVPPKELGQSVAGEHRHDGKHHHDEGSEHADHDNDHDTDRMPSDHANHGGEHGGEHGKSGKH